MRSRGHAWFGPGEHRKGRSHGGEELCLCEAKRVMLAEVSWKGAEGWKGALEMRLTDLVDALRRART